MTVIFESDLAGEGVFDAVGVGRSGPMIVGGNLSLLPPPRRRRRAAHYEEILIYGSVCSGEGEAAKGDSDKRRSKGITASILE